MGETRKYEIDGMIVEIPLYRDEITRKVFENYGHLIENTHYTPEGKPLVLCLDDACKFGEMTEPVTTPDCGTCKYFRRAAEKTLFGVCDCEYKKYSPNEGGKTK